MIYTMGPTVGFECLTSALEAALGTATVFESHRRNSESKLSQARLSRGASSGLNGYRLLADQGGAKLCWGQRLSPHQVRQQATPPTKMTRIAVCAGLHEHNNSHSDK